MHHSRICILFGINVRLFMSLRYLALIRSSSFSSESCSCFDSHRQSTILNKDMIVQPAQRAAGLHATERQALARRSAGNKAVALGRQHYAGSRSQGNPRSDIWRHHHKVNVRHRLKGFSAGETFIFGRHHRWYGSARSSGRRHRISA